MPDGEVCMGADHCRELRLYVLSQTEEPLQSDVRDRIAELKRDCGECRQAVVNLDAEQFLSCRFWRELFVAVAPSDKKPEKIRDAIRAHMRTVRFLGPKAKVSRSAVLGKVTTREDFHAYLMKSGYFPDDFAAALSIADAMSSPIEETRIKWASFELGKFVGWSTFDPAGGRPFASATDDARKLRGRLGLDRSQRKKPVLILEYVLPPTQDAYLPTVAEAYASDPWISYFRPLGDEEERQGFGMTQPWQEYEKERGFPEVVHAPVRGSALAFPLEEFP